MYVRPSGASSNVPSLPASRADAASEGETRIAELPVSSTHEARCPSMVTGIVVRVWLRPLASVAAAEADAGRASCEISRRLPPKQSKNVDVRRTDVRITGSSVEYHNRAGFVRASHQDVS